MMSDIKFKRRGSVIPASTRKAGVDPLENFVEAFLESVKNLHWIWCLINLYANRRGLEQDLDVPSTLPETVTPGGPLS